MQISSLTIWQQFGFSSALGLSEAISGVLPEFPTLQTEEGAQEALAQIVAGHDDPGRRIAQWLGRIRFADSFQFSLLQHQLKRDDLSEDQAILLLEGGGVLSQEVARALKNNQRDGAVEKVTRVFVRQLRRLVTRPEHAAYADLKISEDPSEDRIVIRYMESAEWRLIYDFGRLSIVTAAEALAIAEGRSENIFRPSLSVVSGNPSYLPFAQGEGAEAQSPEGVKYSVFSFEPKVKTEYLTPSEGALAVFRGSPVRREAPIMSYLLLRGTVFQYLAKEKFKEAAGLILSITDEYVLARLVLDFYESKPEKMDTALAFGMTFAEMPSGSVTQILLILNTRIKSELRARLDRWLVAALAAIKPEEVLQEPSSRDELPGLATILGTLIEHKKTRPLAARLIRIGLDERHPDYSLFYRALDYLNYRYDAFLQPYVIIAGGYSRFFDEELSARRSGTPAATAWLRTRRVAPIFEAPADSLATRQEMVAQFQEKLSETEEDSRAMENLSNQIILTLPPADVWRVVDCKAPRLAHLLACQSPEVVAAFFSAWVRSIGNDISLSDAGHALVALWKRGEEGERLVAQTIQQALEEREATVAMQRLFDQVGENDLLDGLVEIYEALTDFELPHASSLASQLNPLEMFFATGVLKPEDLRGEYWVDAVDHAFGILKYGRVGMSSDHLSAVSETWSKDPGYVRLRDEEQVPLDRIAQWDDWALQALVKLKANVEPVTNYLIEGLPTAADLKDRLQQGQLGLDILTPEERKSFDALEAINPEAVVPYYQNLLRPMGEVGRYVGFVLSRADGRNGQKFVSSIVIPPATYFAYMAISTLESAHTLLLTGGFPSTMDHLQIFQCFPLSLTSMKRFVALELFQWTLDSALIKIYGEEVLTLLNSKFLWQCRKPYVIPWIRHLKDEGSNWAVDTVIGAEELIPDLIVMTSLVGTPAAHQALQDFYWEQRGQEWFTAKHKALLVRTLCSLEGKKEWRGPFAPEIYANYYRIDPRIEPRDKKTAAMALHALKTIIASEHASDEKRQAAAEEFKKLRKG